MKIVTAEFTTKYPLIHKVVLDDGHIFYTSVIQDKAEKCLECLKRHGVNVRNDLDKLPNHIRASFIMMLCHV